MIKTRQALASALSLLLLLGFSQCASHQHSVSTSTPLIDLPFYPQEKWQCGPASLAAVLNYRNVDTDPETLKKQIYIPDKKGSLQAEMKAAVRKAELLPYAGESNLENLKTEIKNGNPVIVLQNLGFSWYPKWHYAVVTGFDEPGNRIVLNSGRIQHYSVSIVTFEQTWKRSGRWALVVTEPQAPPASAELEPLLEAALGLENTGHHETAFIVWQAILEKWQTNETALIAVGNFHFAKQQWQLARESFEKILFSNPHSTHAWNNLAYALQKQGCHQTAYQSLQRALSTSEEKGNVLDSIRELSLNESSRNETDAECSLP